MSELAADPAPAARHARRRTSARRTSAARRETLNQILRSKTVWIGAIILAFWVFCAIFGYRSSRTTRSRRTRSTSTSRRRASTGSAPTCSAATSSRASSSAPATS